MKGSQLDVYDKEVIEIAELLVEKWRAYQIDSDNEDPDATAEALEIAVDQRNKNLGVETTIREKAEAIYPKPTPSITVGTQVRLTGVVGDKDGDKRIRVDFGEDAEDEWAWIPCKAKCLEVIRQPFKRGEVVRHKTVDADDCVVVADESDGHVLLVVARSGVNTFEMPADQYERRPSRPKEER